MERTESMALFALAVEEGSLSGAARRSGLSLSSVSRHLTALEERLHVRLLVRSTRALVLTDVGRVYYEQAKRLLAEIDDMETALTAAASAPAGSLRISGPTVFGRAFLLPLLAKFAVLYPAISLDVLLLDREISLIDEGIDVAVRIGSMPDSNLVARKLGQLSWVVSAAPAYLESRGEPGHPRDLSGHACLVYARDDGPQEWTFAVDDKPFAVRIESAMRSNTIDGVVAAAVEGAGLVSSPAWAIAQHLQEGRLQRVLKPYEAPPRPVRAVFTHARLLSAKTRVLIDFLTQHLSDIDFDATLRA
ncbi:MAG: LysR family transcriptional regulator [Paraburkholderia sp.]|jgi:DNA-binding transcriptional LysR family regulator|nr:LysR family transcriptional regulator [Paraburkholderia sp.]